MEPPVIYADPSNNKLTSKFGAIQQEHRTFLMPLSEIFPDFLPKGTRFLPYGNSQDFLKVL